MIESPVQGALKETLQQIADKILDGTGADISLVCLRLDDGTYRIEAYAGDFPVALKTISISKPVREGPVGWLPRLASRV